MNRTQLGIAFSLVAFILSLVWYFTFFTPNIKDIQMSFKSQELSKGNIQFEGFVTNTANSNASEVTIFVKIYDLKFADADLDGSYLYEEIATVKNLKAGETRPIIFRFKHDHDQLEGYPANYNNGKGFNYTIDWDNYKWRVGIANIK